jgi:cytochrome c
MKASPIAAPVLVAMLFAAPALKAAGDAAKGKEVFEQCTVCHEHETDEKKVGPSLKGLYSKEKLANGKPVNDANVLAIVKEGGNGMPAYAEMLESDELEHLMAFLKTLGGNGAPAAKTAPAGEAPDPELVAQGKEAFEQCSVCHNTDSDEKKIGPGLKGLFSKEKLANGKPADEANVLAIIDEGGNGMPAYKEILEEAERKAILAYLKTL